MAISSLRVATAGSQSIACVWLPPVTRSTLGGSSGSESASEPPTRPRSTKFSPQPDRAGLDVVDARGARQVAELQQLDGARDRRVGADRPLQHVGERGLARVVVPRRARLAVPPITTVLSRCSQLSFTVLTPPPGGIEMFAAVQRFAEGLQVRGYVVVAGARRDDGVDAHRIDGLTAAGRDLAHVAHAVELAGLEVDRRADPDRARGGPRC